MTTYTLQGFAVQYGSTGQATQVVASALTFTVADESATFGYDIAAEYPGDLPFVYLDLSGTHRIQVESSLDSGWLRLDRYPGLWLDYEIGTVYWAGNATQVFRILDDQNNRIHTFYLAGAALPPLTTPAQIAAFDATVTGAATTTTGPGFTADEMIDIATLPGSAASENDHFFFGSDFTTAFDAGAGDDLIEVAGDQSDVAGGAGDDTLRLSGYNFYEYDAALIEGGVRLTNRWADHIIRDDVETIVFRLNETLTFDELVALIPDAPLLLEGDNGDNVLLGGEGRDTLRGFGGDDHLSGAGFEDLIEGGAGDDLLDGGAGSDTIDSGTGADLVVAGDGNDYIYLGTDGVHAAGLYAWNVDATWQVGTDARVSVAGLNRMAAVTDGAEGIDFIYLSDGADAFFLHDSFSAFHGSATTATDSFGDTGTARFIGIEYIVAGAGDDVIDLTSPDYSLEGQSLAVVGGDGNDALWGADSDDDLNGGDGDDTLFGGAGSDTLRGGTGADRFEFTRSSTDVLIRDFDGAEGDTLVFYDRGGARFDAGSVAMTDLGFTIDFIESVSGLTETMTIRLAQYDYMMTATLDEVTDALLIL